MRKGLSKFRGYIPYDWKSAPYEKRLFYLRMVEATTQELLAEKLGMVKYNMAKNEWGKKKKNGPKLSTQVENI